MEPLDWLSFFADLSLRIKVAAEQGEQPGGIRRRLLDSASLMSSYRIIR